MTADVINEYRHNMTRAKRNFALCVVELRNYEPPIFRDDLVSPKWRDKADRLRNAVHRAERFARLGDFNAAVAILIKENEPA